MKRNFKRRSMVLLMLVVIMFSNTISHGISSNSKPKIETRGLNFNIGTSSDQIRLLKDFFREIQGVDVPWGYNYDNRTKELVGEYQKSRGLLEDGIGGKSTIDRINEEIQDRKLNIGLRLPSTYIQGDMIIVNKSSNTLYFLQNGVVEDSYPVATGKTISLTPDGQFNIVVKFKDPRWGGAGISDPIPGGLAHNPLGTRWIGISYGGGGKYGIHGNSNPRSIGTYASLGCVRMFNEDVEKLYDKVKINTPVWIGNESLLESYGVEFKYDYKEEYNVFKKEIIQEEKINISINGEELNLKNPIINKHGSTYYPFREMLEFVNGRIIWDGENKKAIGILGGKYVEFQLDNNKYEDSQGYKYLPEGKEVFTYEDKLYAPIRNLMESLGFHVYWEDGTRTIAMENIIKEEIEESNM